MGKESINMRSFVTFLIGTFIAIPAATLVWLISFIIVDQTFLLSNLFAIGSTIIIYLMTSAYRKSSFRKKHGLSNKEYKYIINNLNEAKHKINRLNKAMLSIRHIPSIKQRFDTVRITKKIYNVTKQEPKRFYKAERFYFSHLDSIVELTEKYAFLSSQPVKTRELEESLYETRQTLNQLTKTLEDDLHEFLSNDLDQLNFEIDVAKHSLKTIKDSKIDDKDRRSN